MGHASRLSLFLFCSAQLLSIISISSPCGISLVLIGSTGDLAKRYLWPALFHRFMKEVCLPQPPISLQKCEVLVLGGSREEPVVREGMGEVLSGVKCETLTCELCLERFIRSSRRMKISKEEDYKVVSRFLREYHNGLNQTEEGRIFYLSVPPSAYSNITKFIDTYSRPDQNAWIHIVLEKPFGHNLQSAELLASELEERLEEDEIYRVDHYLGKPGVLQILPFRKANSDKLRKLWNKEHIEHVEVTMRERLDVKGRSSFFDRYGIIRDVFQNHLTEILARILMEASSDNITRKKMDILSQLSSPTLNDSVLGQYEGYKAHLVEDGVLDSNAESFTPTYASVKLHLKDTDWMDEVPLVLIAGKKLQKREALARIVFKQLPYSVVEDSNHLCQSEIVFLIQDEEIKRPGILISHHFSGMDLECGSLECEHSIIRMGNCSYDFLSASLDTSSNAYISLMSDIIEGNRDNFVDTESLMSSWRIWDPLLSEMELAGDNLTLIQYSPDNLQGLIDDERDV